MIMIENIVEAPVYLIDADSDFRVEFAEHLLASGFEVRTFNSAYPFLEQLDTTRDGCILMDIRTPGVGGMGLLRQLVEQAPWLPVIMTSSQGDVDSAVRALKLGAFDFMQKPLQYMTLLECVHKAIQQGRDARQHCGLCARIRQRLESLSGRERQVLDCLLEGMANKQIAAALTLSPRTVEVHRSHIMRKMQARSIAELINQYCLQHSIKRCAINRLKGAPVAHC